MTVADPLLYRYAEAARLLGVSTRTIRRLVSAGTLRAVNVGSAKRVPRTELQRLIDTPTDAAQEAL